MQKSGIDKIFPNAILDGYLFDPCGYSVNAILPDVIWIELKFNNWIKKTIFFIIGVLLHNTYNTRGFMLVCKLWNECASEQLWRIDQKNNKYF